MNFDLTEEQVLIRESARRFAEERSAPQDGGGFDRGGWAELAALGFLVLGLPEHFDGVGGPVEVSLACREFGAGPVSLPYVAAGLFPAHLVNEAGSEAQKREILAALSQGERLVSVAYRDSPEGGVVTGAPTTFRREGAGYVLEGHKCLAIAATAADQLVVTATPADAGPDRRALSLFLVDRAAPGVRVTPTPLVDGSLCGEVRLDNVRLGAESVLELEGQGAGPLHAALRWAILGGCSQTAGAMGKAMRLGSEYLQTRRQFGHALSSFQVLRHKIADMTIDCEMADSAILKMIASFQSPDQHDPEASSAIAKVVVDEAGHRVCSQAIQIHGGMGMTEECGVGRYFRQVTLNKALFGSTLDHTELYIELLRRELTGVGTR